jgi:hypothetical protein
VGFGGGFGVLEVGLGFWRWDWGFGGGIYTSDPFWRNFSIFQLDTSQNTNHKVFTVILIRGVQFNSTLALSILA